MPARYATLLCLLSPRLSRGWSRPEGKWTLFLRCRARLIFYIIARPLRDSALSEVDFPIPGLSRIPANIIDRPSVRSSVTSEGPTTVGTSTQDYPLSNLRSAQPPESDNSLASITVPGPVASYDPGGEESGVTKPWEEKVIEVKKNIDDVIVGVKSCMLI